jgi:hypothetical protein
VVLAVLALVRVVAAHSGAALVCPRAFVRAVQVFRAVAAAVGTRRRGRLRVVAAVGSVRLVAVAVVGAVPASGGAGVLRAVDHF